MSCLRLGLTVGLLAVVGCSFDGNGLEFHDDAAVPADAAVDAAPPAPDAATKASDQVLDGLAPAQLAGATDAHAWALRASAAQVVFAAYLAVTDADKLHRDGDPCPAVVSDGERSSYTGGCTSKDGHEWMGSARVIGPLVDGVPPSVSYDHFGHTSQTHCKDDDVATRTLYTGTVVRTAGPALAHAITVDLVLDELRATSTCTTETTAVGIDYQLTMQNGPDVDLDGAPDFRRYDGHGRVGKASGENLGLVTASTTGEGTGDACSTEALEGSSQITAGAHTVGIAYDGLTDCDGTSSVTWTLDGAAQGELTGVACAIAPGGRGRGPAPAAALVLLVGLVLAHRRGRRR